MQKYLVQKFSCGNRGSNSLRKLVASCTASVGDFYLSFIQDPTIIPVGLPTSAPVTATATHKQTDMENLQTQWPPSHNTTPIRAPFMLNRFTVDLHPPLSASHLLVSSSVFCHCCVDDVEQLLDLDFLFSVFVLGFSTYYQKHDVPGEHSGLH